MSHQIKHKRVSKNGKVFSAGHKDPVVPVRRNINDVLGLPDLMLMVQFGHDELKKHYPVSVHKGTLLYRGPSAVNPAASNFKELFSDDDSIQVREKPLYHVAHFSDLFRYGKHVKIFNQRGDLIRELRLVSEGVLLDPKSGNQQDILLVNPSDDILYEPWFDDVGSFMFIVPNNGPLGLRGHLLKLAVEKDGVVSDG